MAADPDTQPVALQRIDNAPLAERARAAILDAIVSKQFEKRLPAEDVLAEMLNVSRTTIRTALHTLEQEGIITRRRAIGTTINAHVRPSALALQRLVGFDGLLTEKGYDVRVEADWSRREPPADFVDAFQADPGDDLLLTSKRYFADDALAIYIRDAIPWSELQAPDSVPKEIPPSVFDFSRQYCRRPVDHAIVEIVAKVNVDGITQLAVGDGEPFTRLHERHYSSDGELLATSVIDVDGDYVRFEVFRRQ
jgi:GntR family transcriptional regulator